MKGIFTAASNLDIDGWLRGLFSAAISGGASAVSGAIVLPALDANDFNVYQWKFYVAIGALFTASALTSIMKFLAATPLPNVKQVSNTVQTIEQPGAAPKTITTVKEVHVEPADPKP
jgi:hypothetical protein